MRWRRRFGRSLPTIMMHWLPALLPAPPFRTLTPIDLDRESGLHRIRAVSRSRWDKLHDAKPLREADEGEFVKVRHDSPRHPQLQLLGLSLFRVLVVDKNKLGAEDPKPP